MADETKEVLFKVDIDTSEGGENIQKLTNDIESLTQSRQAMVEQNKQLVKDGKQLSEDYLRNANNIEINKNKVKQLTAERQQLIKSIGAEKGSITDLQAQNKQLLEQRNKLSSATAEGKAKIDAINKAYDENTKKINGNISETEKQKQGYNTLIEILDKINPGTKELVHNVGSITDGFSKSVGAINQYGFSLKALGQVPILATLTALTGVLTTVKQIYVDSLPKAEDYLKVTEKITKEYEKQEAALIKIEASAARRAKVLRSEGDELAALQTEQKATIDRMLAEQIQLDKLNKEYEILQTQISNTLPEYDKLTGTHQINKAETEALAEASGKLKNQIEQQREVVEELVAEYGILEDAEARVINQKSKDYKDQKEQTAEELERLRKLSEARQKLLDLRMREALAGLAESRGQGDAEAEAIRKVYDKLVENSQKEREKRQQIGKDKLDKDADKFFATQKKLRDKDAADKKRAADDEIKIEKYKNQALAGFIDQNFKKKSAARTFLSTVFKADAIKETIISTKAAAIAAYKSLAGIPFVGPLLGGAAAAAVAVFGAQQIASIQGVGFAKGGKVLSGQRIQSYHGTPIRRDNGDNLIATVRTGEVILNERQQRALGGAKTFARIGVPGFNNGGFVESTRIAAQQVNDQRALVDIANAIINRPNEVLVLEKFEAKQLSVNEVRVESKVF